MSAHDQHSAHLSRTEYVGMPAALFDAVRVLHDLEDLTDGQLVVPVNELTFLLRRARQLVAACVELAMTTEEG